MLHGRTLVAVAVGPADGSRVLPEETPGVGFPVWVPAVAVVAQPSARVLHDVVWKLGPLQTGGARVRLRHGTVVVSQLRESLRAGQRHCTKRAEEGVNVEDDEENKMFWQKQEDLGQTGQNE